MEFCPYCYTRYKPNSEFCSYCGSLRVEYRFCSNPNCRNYDRPCGDEDECCPYCGERTSFVYIRLHKYSRLDLPLIAGLICVACIIIIIICILH